MVNVKELLRTMLTTDSALNALVPATQIFFAWPSSWNAFPVISYKENDNKNADESYFDDMPIYDQADVQIDVWTEPGKSPTAIVNRIDAIMKADRWNRDYSGDLVEPDTALNHKILRYSNKLYNNAYIV